MVGKSITIIGINAAGIASKIESFDKMLFDRKPSIWMMQETKRKQMDPRLRANNLINYQVFEMRREKTKDEGGKGLHGGGLAVGALHDLLPVLIRQGDDDTECMTIQVSVGHLNMHCVVGYGPQLTDSSDRKNKFWNYLDQSVEAAKAQNAGLVIEVDSNAWAG